MSFLCGEISEERRLRDFKIVPPGVSASSKHVLAKIHLDLSSPNDTITGNKVDTDYNMDLTKSSGVDSSNLCPKVLIKRNHGRKSVELGEI